MRLLFACGRKNQEQANMEGNRHEEHRLLCGWNMERDQR
jgi:hypothetical protein